MRRPRTIEYAPSEGGTGIFSASEIAAANNRHDRAYGWIYQEPHNYRNVLRLPETVIGDFYDYLAKQHEEK